MTYMILTAYKISVSCYTAMFLLITMQHRTAAEMLTIEIIPKINDHKLENELWHLSQLNNTKLINFTNRVTQIL